MESIFETAALGGVVLKNRVIRSATHEGMGDLHGRPAEMLGDLYVTLAKGGAGAILTGLSGVEKRGRALKNMLMINRDDYISDFRKITARVHAENTPILMQLVHAGRQTDKSTTGGLLPVAPSPLKDRVHNQFRPQALTPLAIKEIVNNFTKAALRAQKSGFDGVQLHIAHGFLLSQFLSPYTNIRRDEWGGSTENRFRIVHEIIAGIKRETGNFPVWAKLNGHDNRPGGMTIEEAVKAAKLLENSGCSAIEVSCGVSEDRLGLNTVRTTSPPIESIISMVASQKRLSPFSRWLISKYLSFTMKKPLETEKYNVPAAAAIKENVSTPVIAVGGIKRLDDIIEIITSGKADAVSMARPFVKEPDIVNRMITGRQKRTQCTGCGSCLFETMTSPLRCHAGNS